MLLRTKGTPHRVNKYKVGYVTRDIHTSEKDAILLYDNPEVSINDFNGQAVLTLFPIESDYLFPIVYNIPTLNHLSDGDIVLMGEDGNISTLYRLNSYHNTLLATERCNSNCLMCSQPPRDRDDIERLYAINKKLISLIPKDCIELGISGGEPTLMGERFFELLEVIKEELPETEVHLLTNGRSFAWNDFTERLATLQMDRLMLGIPVYSDFYLTHDYIVQAKNAFYQTILGIHNLARYNQRVEIRIVLHKETIPRLAKLAKYIYKNMPFAEHVAFMGLEYVGYTPYNDSKLWIDPYDYQNELSEAVEFLSGQGMNVSIYNLQLCVLPENLWKYSRKSISDWKNDYLPACQSCTKVSECGGLFVWNLKKHSNFIKPFVI